MIIAFSPVRLDATLAAERAGDTLTLNGEAFDFAPLAEGATLPRAAVACPWLASDVTRQDGVIRLTLILPLGPGAPAASWSAPPLAGPPDGTLALPPAGPSEDLP